jgi:type IV secretion system protein VirB10
MPTPAELTAAFDALAGRPALGSPAAAWPRPAGDHAPLPAVTPPPTTAPPPRNLLPAAADSRTHHAVLAAPASPYLLRAGELLPAVLAQRVVSDQPGSLRAVVSRDVRDSLAGTSVLVPRGTVLLGRQGSLPGFGQDRLAVLWTRLLFPDGRSLELDSDGATPAASAARDGTAGLRGRVNHHWGRRYAAAALLSLVGAGVQLSQPQSGNLLERDAPGSRAAGALGLELGRTTEDILRRYADLPPTIELAPGARVHAVLLQDLAFASPYQPLHR